ncbi:hypothetical protein Tco_0019614, partial [Tanacetum coccineum]
MNDKSKDTAKARQDLKSLGIRSGLWLGQNKNGKCSKPQAAYSFTPADRKKFCQFIKGVKLPDGFGSNFKHKVTDNDTNITGLKSHDCHIMMQRLLPYGLQQYLPPDVAKPLIELCLFFKQICSQTLMVDDMLKAQSKVIDILCNLELIYPPAFFDIMIHLVIHLPLEAIFGGPIRPRWMYPFERYMKKLKNYVRNKAKPEGSIAEGYVAEEALTFSSHYFRDVTTKFNRPDRNVDCPPPTCQFQVFKSLCKSIGLRSVIRIDHQELKKVIWYVLHNSPEIDTYRAKFKIEFPNKDMKEEFPGWFGKQIRQRHVDNDPGVSESSELFALACGPSQTPISVNSCVVNGDGEMYYGQLEQILEFSYLSFKTVLFRVKWFDTSNKGRIQNFVIRNNITQIKANGEAFKNDQYILATQVKQCFYLEDMARRPLGWKVVEHVSHKKFLNGGVIVVEDDPDVIHVDNSSDLALSTSLNDLEIAALHIDDVSGCRTGSRSGLFGDGGGDVRPLHNIIRLRAHPKSPIWVAGERAGRHTRQETRNLGLKAITDKSGPVPIRLRLTIQRDPHALSVILADSMWANYLGQGRSALKGKIFGFLKRTGLNDWSASDADVSLPLAHFEMETQLLVSTVADPHLLLDTYCLAALFLNPRTIARYDEMLRLQGLGSKTSTGVPYTEDEIMAIVKMFMKLFRIDDKFSQMLAQLESQPEYGGGSGSGGCEDNEPGDDEDGDKDEEDGPAMSPGKVARERIPFELFRSTYPG